MLLPLTGWIDVGAAMSGRRFDLNLTAFDGHISDS